jgi:hypothetical protein
MWVVDEAFLTAVAEGAEECVTPVEVTRDRPYVDIEAISDLGLSTTTAGEFVERFRRLRRPFNESRASDLLVSCGDLAADGLTDGVHDTWTRGLAGIGRDAGGLLLVPGNHDLVQDDERTSFYRRFPPKTLGEEPPVPPHEFPVASVLRVATADEPGSSPLAFIAVIGFDSNDARHHNEHIRDHGQIGVAQLGASRRLVEALVSGVAVNTPLYVIGVAHHTLLPGQDRVFSGPVDRDGLANCGVPLECRPGEVSAFCASNHVVAEGTAGWIVNSPEVLAHCRDVRMSLVLHADMRSREVVTLSSTPLVPGGRPSELSIVACPSFAGGAHAAGMVRLRLNLWKGEAEVAFSYGADSDGQDRAIQIIRPLVSASRISTAERRLYDTVGRMIERTARTASPAGAESLAGFKDHVERMWEDTGYVALCEKDGSLPGALQVTRRTSYFLLLLLRERPDGGHDLLLSNHTPLQATPLGSWGTLLLPAFRNVRTLLEHLRADVLRQVVDQAQDLEKAAHVRAFEAAVGRILDDAGSVEEEVWADQLCEVTAFTRTKISPVTGCVTEYTYHLVTLLPFVRRPDVTVDSGTPAEREAAAQRRRDYTTIIEWLNELPTIVRRNAEGRGSRIPIEVLHVDGGGLRWEPAASHDGRLPEPQAAGTGKLPPGAVWFPFPEPGDDPADAPWRRCPAIVTRNADVMSSIEKDLTKRRDTNGFFPDELVVGKLSPGGRNVEVVGEQYPFEASSGRHRPTAETPAGSTAEALSKVRYVDGYDLEGGYPYRDLEPRRTFLVRREITVRGVRRPVILVFDAGDHDREAVLHAAAESALGVLRPVQRYVMRAGLERAGDLYERVTGKMADAWGFAKVKRGNAVTPAAVTPPIVEQLHPADCEGETAEFILCDGNHRVVELVWNRRLVLPAVTLVGEPAQPYYAKPFSRFEWEYTAENVQDRSPDQASKYAVRKVDLSALDPVSAAKLQQRSPKEWHRRYYRDLTAGFGYLGGQGGRYV